MCNCNLIAATLEKNLYAFPAESEDGQMFQFCPETILIRQCAGKRREGCLIQVNDPGAFRADKMMMVFMSHAVETYASVTHIGLGHYTEFLQQIKSAVDGGDIEV